MPFERNKYFGLCLISSAHYTLSMGVDKWIAKVMKLLTFNINSLCVMVSLHLAYDI